MLIFCVIVDSIPAFEQEDEVLSYFATSMF